MVAVGAAYTTVRVVVLDRPQALDAVTVNELLPGVNATLETVQEVPLIEAAWPLTLTPVALPVTEPETVIGWEETVCPLTGDVMLICGGPKIVIVK